MKTVPLPVLGEIFLVAMAGLIAIYEGWLFSYGRGRANLWTAMIAIQVGALSVLMLVHFGVTDEETAVLLTRLEGVAITALVHSMLAFTEAVTARRLPGPRHWVLGSWVFFTLLMFSPWLVTGVSPQRMALLPEPFLRRTLNPGLIVSQVYGFGLVGLASYWFHRHRHEHRRQARFFFVGLVIWALFGVVSAVATTVTDAPYPGGLVEYGFGVFALCLVAADVTHYMQLLTRSQAARETAETELSTVQKRELQTTQTFQALIEHAPDPIAICHGDELVHVNQAMVSTLGYERASQLQNRSYDSVHAPEDESDNLRSEGASQTRWRCHDGSFRHVEVIVLEVELDERPARILIGRDITEQRELTAKVMQVDRMIAVGTLAAGVGHEINNPLSYLVLSLEQAQAELARSSADRTALKSLVDDAEDAAQRITNIVDALRDSSRSAEEQETEPLAKSVRAAVSMTTHQAKHRTEIDVHIGSEQPVLANQARLTQVFVNLIMNAVHALPDGRRENLIAIEVYDHPSDSDLVVAQVADNGSGMDAETQRRALDPFFTTKPVGVGTGLGLSICQDTIDALGGRLAVQSTLGEGTTMTVTLPVGEAAVPSARPQPVTLPPGCPPILVVDDEPILLLAVERALRGAFEVVTVSDPEGALALLEEGLDPYVILSDLMMPTMSGMEFHAQVTARFSNLEARMLFMSGGAFTPESKSFCAKMGRRVLSKPLKMTAIADAVAAHGAKAH